MHYEASIKTPQAVLPAGELGDSGACHTLEGAWMPPALLPTPRPVHLSHPALSRL